MESFTDLQAWKVGMELVREIYTLTRTFPPEERFGMTSQLRRAVTSILANYAEGFSRRSPADKAHKYTIARSECSETQAFLLMSVALNFVSQEQAQRAIDLVRETGKIMTGLIQTHLLQSSYSLPPSPYS